MITDDEFVEAVRQELLKARRLFPEAAAVNAALVEEVGEVSTALMYEPWNNVIAEAVQVAAMAQRLAVEGDSTMRQFRNDKVHDNGTRYTPAEFVMPGMSYACNAPGTGYANIATPEKD